MRLFARNSVAYPAALAALALLSVASPVSPATPNDQGPGVYLRLVEGADLPFEEVASMLEDRLVQDGWTVVTDLDCGVDESACAFRSRVIVAYPDEYVDEVMAYGVHAAFALPIRFVVWEDEHGVNVGATNPMNLNRTIVDEETVPEDWAMIAARIRSVTATAAPHSLREDGGRPRRHHGRLGTTPLRPAGRDPPGRGLHSPVRPADVFVAACGRGWAAWRGRIGLHEAHPRTAQDSPHHGREPTGLIHVPGPGCPVRRDGLHVVRSRARVPRDSRPVR